jgi:Lon protease-like protein
MGMNAVYRGPGDLPSVIPVFPLPGALLLPAGQMPLNIFEPRYMAMIDDALKSGHRLVGMIQPDATQSGPPARPPLFKVGTVGRITQIAETGDNRYLLQLTGIARFMVTEELPVITAYRQCRVDFAPFALDFGDDPAADDIDRDGLLAVLARFLEANNLKADWDDIRKADNTSLVNALCMMSPFGAPEKQALLEAANLRDRCAMLIALTEIELAKTGKGGETSLQ